MSQLISVVRQAMEAYNDGDSGPLLATFSPNITYTIVDLGKTYRGAEEVGALARQGEGQTQFHLHSFICHGSLLSFTYDHENPIADIAYNGPGLAVQKYDDEGKLLAHWAYRK